MPVGSGIGCMLAKGFAVNGAKIILVDINAEGLQETERICQEAAASVGLPEVLVWQIIGDLTSEQDVNEIAISVRSACILGSLDVVIHCAAYRHMNVISYTHDPSSPSLTNLATATASASWTEWDRSFRINVLAPYFLTARLIDLLGAATKLGYGRGSVILFSSPASVHAHQFVPAYQTTKAAVDHLTKILAAEFAGFYIRVNAMSPGLVPSAMSDVNDPASNIHLAKDSPSKVAGAEEDMVGTAVWLSSRAGAYMDGKVVRVDGGRLLVLQGAGS
ncbi:hypothetical protein LTR85_011780 [Meristemomyces frigidus]|nr:hypothetical protein LTR85_011780 [Meristemomyces frigidus]